MEYVPIADLDYSRSRMIYTPKKQSPKKLWRRLLRMKKPQMEMPPHIMSYDAESFEAEDEPQAYLMCDWNKKVPYEIHNAGCKHRNFYEKRWESDIDLWNPTSLDGVCREYIQLWEENLGGTDEVDGEDLDAIAKMTFSQFMRSNYTKTTTPIKLSPCHKQNPKIKEFMDNTLVGDISPLTYLDLRKRAESFEADNCIECGEKKDHIAIQN